MNLWYEQEAQKWTEALPIGNGRLGAMVYGKHGTETISLNEDTLWSGYPCYKGPRNKAGLWQQIRELSEGGKFAEAQALFEDEIASPWSQSYLPMGDLLLKFNHHDIKAYKRSLDWNCGAMTAQAGAWPGRSTYGPGFVMGTMPLRF